MTKNELLAKAIEFDAGMVVHLNGYICGQDDGMIYHHYTISLRTNEENQQKWAICDGRLCLSKSKQEFVYETFPSSRTEDFINDTRFDSVEEAFEFLEEWKKKELVWAIKQNYQVWKK